MQEQKLASELIGRGVLSIRSGLTVGTAVNFLARKENMQIELLIIKQAKKDENLYLLTKDIRTIEEGKIIINSEENLSSKNELIRHHATIDSEFNIIGSKVETLSGKKLGRVEDATIDYVDFLIIKLHVKAGFMMRIIHHSLIIDSSDIIKVKKNNTIVVKDGFVKNRQAATSLISITN